MVLILKLLILLFSASCFELVGGTCTPPPKNCGKDQILIKVNNCSKCVCREGFFHHRVFSSCYSCHVCESPKVVIQNCTRTMDTKCGLCPMNYYNKNKGCRKCKQCNNTVLRPCGKAHDTVCTPLTMTKPTYISTIGLSTASYVCKNQTYYIGPEHEKFQIWFYLFILVSVILVFVIVCQKFGRRIYTPIENSSLTGMSWSSLILNSNSNCPDLSSLTEEECNKLISILPGGYVEELGLLLNGVTGAKNWVQLAYEFHLTQQHVANLKLLKEPTQELLLFLNSKNVTVEQLWYGLKGINRDDACNSFLKFILNLRNDDESVTVFENF